MQDLIWKLINEKPKHAVRMIFINPDYITMKTWVEQHCDPMSNTNAIKLYTALTGEKVLCPCGSGKLRKLESLTKGFFFCGRASVCSAARESVSKNCIKAAKCWDKEAAKEKREKTNLERYGVENIGQTQKAIQARAELYADKGKVAEIEARIKQTNLEKRGVENPMQSHEVQEKRKETLLRIHGVEYPIQNQEVNYHRLKAVASCFTDTTFVSPQAFKESVVPTAFLLKYFLIPI
ncbi:Uncharacterised protein [uncultured archaeon]|nr:Uncharacterised protein [uncultured archaeon]